MNTKEEIKSCLHEPILDLYNHYSSKQFYEVDTILFVTLHYLDMSGGAKHELILKLIKFSSHGIKVSVSNLLEKMIKNEKLELHTVVEDLTDKDIFDPDRTPSNSSHPGIVNIRGKPSTRPTDYDPSWDGFDKAKFQSSSNTGCKFVRTKSVTFIAASSNLADLMYHKLNRPVPCGIPDCEVVFEFGKTVIGRALICSPENHPSYGLTPMVCAKHIKQSTDNSDETIFEVVAVRNEGENLPFNPDRKKIVKSLFNEPQPSKSTTYNPEDIYYSDGEQLPNTNIIQHPLSPSGSEASRGEDETKGESVKDFYDENASDHDDENGNVEGNKTDAAGE